MKIRHMIAAAMAAGLAAMPASAATKEAAFAAVAKRFEQAARKEKVVGGAMTLIDDGRIVGETRFGLADAATGRKIDADTLFHWASITKTFTAIAAMQLVERGLIKLDEPVAKYVPEFRQAHNPFGPIEAVTIRHLITHSAGLRESTWPWHADGASEAAPWQRHEPPGWEQLFAMMPYTGLEFAPGTKYAYSNPGTSLVGRVVEMVSGDDIEIYIDKNILKPLGMTRSYFDVTPWHLQASRSNSYAWQNGSKRTFGREFDTGVTSGNGGLNGPIADMLLYMNFLLGVGDRARHEQVLRRETLVSMWEPLFRTDYDDSVDERMAKTFFVIDARGSDGKSRRYIGHTGSQRGYRAFFYILPGAGSGAVMAVNTTVAGAARPFVFDTRRALFEKVFPLTEAR